LKNLTLRVAEREFVPIVSVSSSISKDNRLDSVVSSSVVGTVGMKLPTGGQFSFNILQLMKNTLDKGGRIRETVMFRCHFGNRC